MPSLVNPAFKDEDEFSLGDRVNPNNNFNSLTFKTEIMSSRTQNAPKIYDSRRRYIAVSILCIINLINYMDRFTIAGILMTVKGYYSLNNTEAGLLQTAFVVSYMIMAPLFGYLGDRYSRKLIMAFGVMFWSLTTLLGSFIPPHLFGVFIFLRALVGTGEASYSTIAPTIIADLFSKDKRSKMLAVFYFAIPVGSGLGYITGEQILQATGEWQWSLRITPIFGFLSVFLTFIFIRDPPRGAADGGVVLEKSELGADLLYLIKTKSFVYSTLGFTCVTFATGALGWFGPTYMELALAKHSSEPAPSNSSLIFGIITCIAGIVGVIIGSFSSTHLRKFHGKADPLICAYGVLASVPLIFSGFVTSEYSVISAWVLIFLGEVCLCVNWTIVADMLLYVVIPTRRSIAAAVQILVSHALGDACSPYIIGMVSDAIYHSGNLGLQKYLCLQYALYIPTGVLVLGAFFFFLTALHIEKDKGKCSFATHASKNVNHMPDSPTMLPAENAFIPKLNKTENSVDSKNSLEVTAL